MEARPAELLAYAQAAYFAATGVWPIVHMPSFLAVTGPKRDLWLVKTVGALVAAVALPIGVAAWNKNVTPEIVLLAAGTAATLGAVDVVYVAKRVIPKVYLFDAAAEALLIAGWAAVWFRMGGGVVP